MSGLREKIFFIIIIIYFLEREKKKQKKWSKLNIFAGGRVAAVSMAAVAEEGL